MDSRKLTKSFDKKKSSIKSAPTPNPKKSAHMLKLWACYGLSNPARKKFWALFSNEKTIIQNWAASLPLSQRQLFSRNV